MQNYTKKQYIQIIAARAKAALIKNIRDSRKESENWHAVFHENKLIYRAYMHYLHLFNKFMTDAHKKIIQEFNLPPGTTREQILEQTTTPGDPETQEQVCSYHVLRYRLTGNPPDIPLAAEMVNLPWADHPRVRALPLGSLTHDQVAIAVVNTRNQAKFSLDRWKNAIKKEEWYRKGLQEWSVPDEDISFSSWLDDLRSVVGRDPLWLMKPFEIQWDQEYLEYDDDTNWIDYSAILPWGEAVKFPIYYY